MANAATARYWRQVRAVQRMTGASSAVARRAVSSLRESRGYTTAAETARHPIVVQRTTSDVERTIQRDRAIDVEPPPVTAKPYANLDDWISSWESWEGDYDYYEIESNVDY
jgi:hypothetical protein